MRPTLLLLLGSAGVLLLVSAVNLANMLLARAAAREREMVVRRAIGAGSLRLVRQLLTESLVLAGVGGVLGVAAAVWGVQLWRTVWEDPSGLPAAAAVDWRVVLASRVGATAATALLFGLAPAVRVTAVDSAPRSVAAWGPAAPSGAAHGSWWPARSGSRSRWPSVAASSSGVCCTSRRWSPGFDPTGVLARAMSLPEASYGEPQQVIGFYRRLLEEVRAIPACEAAGAARGGSDGGGAGTFGFTIQGRPVPAVQEWPNASMMNATPDYFRTLGHRAGARPTAGAAGRQSAATWRSSNETMARRFWPGARRSAPGLPSRPT